MEQAGSHELKHDASAEFAAEEHVVITNRGRPDAQPDSPIERLRASGVLRPATRSLSDLPVPEPAPEGNPTLGEVLQQMRDDERY